MSESNIFSHFVKLLQCGGLPKHFTQWGMATESGWSLAHEAARTGKLPANFSRWELADNTGWTVAHEAAKHGHLPKGFSRWDLTDHTLKTVAYVAFCSGEFMQENLDELENNIRNNCLQHRLKQTECE